ncbi:MAG: DUF3465 domain-containing protein [Desulfobacterales bacterium]|nr:DUF3465 domain-containing protein [Desulfobacterales bacterium]
MKRLFILVLVFLAAGWILDMAPEKFKLDRLDFARLDFSRLNPGQWSLDSLLGKAPLSTSDAALKKAYDTRANALQVGGSGTVIKILPDDTKGRRHQRFIIELASGQTLLVAHNIDIAPRLTGLVTGDHINFYGVYEYNDKGGVIHWTHRDPGGRHVDGWIMHNGQLLQ